MAVRRTNEGDRGGIRERRGKGIKALKFINNLSCTFLK
jgi:hypothetical protein